MCRNKFCVKDLYTLKSDLGPKIAQLQGQILDSLSMQIGVDDMMRSKLRELEKKRDKFDVKYETSRFEAMIGFGTESAFEAK